MKNIDVARIAVLHELLGFKFGFNFKNSFYSDENLIALEKMSDEIVNCRKKLSVFKKGTKFQESIVTAILRHVVFERKKSQKKMLRILRSGKVISFAQIQKVFPLKQSRGQNKSKWINATSRRVCELEKTLLNLGFQKYLNIAINYIKKPIEGYKLTIKDNDEYPYSIIE